MSEVENHAKCHGEKLQKSPTGIRGLDEITEGGLPKGRPTLICGSAGSGKTLLAMQFLANGATRFEEPGVFMALRRLRPIWPRTSALLG